MLSSNVVRKLSQPLTDPLVVELHSQAESMTQKLWRPKGFSLNCLLFARARRDAYWICLSTGSQGFSFETYWRATGYAGRIRVSALTYTCRVGLACVNVLNWVCASGEYPECQKYWYRFQSRRLLSNFEILFHILILLFYSNGICVFVNVFIWKYRRQRRTRSRFHAQSGWLRVDDVLAHQSCSGRQTQR